MMSIASHSLDETRYPTSTLKTNNKLTFVVALRNRHAVKYVRNNWSEKKRNKFETNQIAIKVIKAMI
jgi:hypothetical protein